MVYEWDFLIVLAVLLVGIFVYAGRKKIRDKNKSKAMDILNERYASGEINKDEYEERKSGIVSKDNKQS